VPGDVLRPITQTLEFGQHEEHQRPGQHDARVLLHLVLQRLDAPMIEFVELVVARDHLFGGGRIAFGIGPHHVAQHLVGDRGDPADLDASGAQRDIGQFDRVLRNVDGVVADAFEVDNDLQHRRDLTQLAGHRLLLPDQLDALTFDLAAQVIDGIVTRDNACGQIGVALFERGDGRVNGVGSEGSEPDDVEPGSFELLVVRGAHDCSVCEGRASLPRKRRNVDYETLTLERDGSLAVVTLNRPKVLNALNGQMVAELRGLLAELDADAAVRAIVLTGAGERAFAAGADIGELNQLPSATQGVELARRGQALTLEIERMRTPVIAAVNGFALGGGCELALACDIRIASENAKFGQPEVNLGLMPGYGGSQRTARLAGRGMAMYLCLSGEPIDAREAQRVGLVEKVVPATELLTEAKRIAGVIASKGPLAVSATKRAIDEGLALSTQAALDVESLHFGTLIDTEDFKEGTKAFLEKRPAQFTGR